MNLEKEKQEMRESMRKRRSIMKRENRDYGEIDKAYSKYYEKIKARYRNYVKNLFPNPKARIPQLNNSYPQEEVKNTRKIQVQDGRWYNVYNNPEFRYRATHKSRTFSKDSQNEDFDSELGPPVALPSINDPTRSNRYEAHNGSVSNYYPSYIHNTDKHQVVEEPHEGLRKLINATDAQANIYAQLQSQIVRRKRELEDDAKSN